MSFFWLFQAREDFFMLEQTIQGGTMTYLARSVVNSVLNDSLVLHGEAEKQCLISWRLAWVVLVPVVVAHITKYWLFVFQFNIEALQISWDPSIVNESENKWIDIYFEKTQDIDFKRSYFIIWFMQFLFIHLKIFIKKCQYLKKRFFNNIVICLRPKSKLLWILGRSLSGKKIILERKKLVELGKFNFADS